MPKKKELCEKFSKAKKNYVFKARSTKNGVTKHWIIEEVGARDITATSLFYYLQKMMSYSPFVSPSSISFFKILYSYAFDSKEGEGATAAIFQRNHYLFPFTV